MAIETADSSAAPEAGQRSAREMSGRRLPDIGALSIAGILGAILMAGIVLEASGQLFWFDVLVRIVILAIAAVSVSFIVATAGLVSFGHAVFVGIGAYSVGIAAHHEITNGFAHLAIALGASAFFAFVTGLLALRTRGIHFIMITMAFSQVVYYVMIGLTEYGGDDGLTIYDNSEFPLLDLSDRGQLFYVAMAVLAGAILFYKLLRQSAFGLVLSSARDNEQRVRASGLDPIRHRLIVYVISAMITSLSGVLTANLTTFVSPDLMAWTRSGELLFIVTLGGLGSMIGAIAGSGAFIGLEEVLSGWTTYWHFHFGLFLIAITLFRRPIARRLGLDT
ncbi:MAG: branched-chain amino acid ABC transporter permease [Pseudomonadota bacterium]